MLLLFIPEFDARGIGFEYEDDWEAWCTELFSGSWSRQGESSANASASNLKNSLQV